MSTASDPVLECQDCGTVLQRLTLAEAARVARDPYAFVLYCSPCGAEHEPPRRDRRRYRDPLTQVGPPATDVCPSRPPSRSGHF